MMYRCESCGHLFEEGEQKIEFSYLADYGSKPVYEKHLCCPVCGGDYEEITACKICNGFEHMKSEQDYCEACKTYVKNKFQRILRTNFTDEEKKLLNDLYDGEAF